MLVLLKRNLLLRRGSSRDRQKLGVLRRLLVLRRTGCWLRKDRPYGLDLGQDTAPRPLSCRLWDRIADY